MNKEIPKCACGVELHLAAKGVVTKHFCLQRKTGDGHIKTPVESGLKEPESCKELVDALDSIEKINKPDLCKELKITAFISYEGIPQEYRQNKAFVLMEDLNKVVDRFQSRLAAKDKEIKRLTEIAKQAIDKKGSE